MKLFNFKNIDDLHEMSNVVGIIAVVENILYVIQKS